ncbi:putative protease 2-like [Capsicum annuum]|nr:putative protease 2-like [Capsicum annuum]
MVKIVAEIENVESFKDKKWGYLRQDGSDFNGGQDAGNKVEMIRACDEKMRRGEMRESPLQHKNDKKTREHANGDQLFINRTYVSEEQVHLQWSQVSFAAGAGEVPMKLSYDLYCVKHLSISSIYLSDSDEVESDDNDIPALESLQVGRFSDVTFIHLREVKLMQTNGTIPGLQLMKLPFAKSPKMMRMLIEPCLVEESATIKILAELIKFERASPNAEVEYKLDKHSNPRRV